MIYDIIVVSGLSYVRLLNNYKPVGDVARDTASFAPSCGRCL